MRLKAKKLMVIFLGILLVFSLIGCKKQGEGEVPVTENEKVVDGDKEEGNKEEKNEELPVSIDFEDGVYGFVRSFVSPVNADKSELSIVDFNGSKALKVTNMTGGVPYVAIDIASLTGDMISQVHTITMDIGIENPDGKFYACSGDITAYSGTERVKSKDPWSVYMEKKNPNTAKAILDEGEEFESGYQNLIILTLEVDNGVSDGAKNANICIDNIRIIDKSGNVITTDNTVAFDAPADFDQVDRSNLISVKNEVEIWSGDGGGAWEQGTGVMTVANDGPFDPALLTENSVITIYYQSDSAVWLVAQSWIEGAPFSWERIGYEGKAQAIYNNTGTIAQITYNQLAEACRTEDFVTYLSQLQCEGEAEWSISSVTIGEQSGVVELRNEVELWNSDGGGAWEQGTGMETIANSGTIDPELIKPGSVININYISEGAVWLVAQSYVDGAPFSWERVGYETGAYSDGSVCQISYDVLKEICKTEDFVTYLSKLQVEGEAEWTALSITIGYPSGLVPVNQTIELPLAGEKGGSWNQGAGVLTLANEGPIDPAVLQPGSVITIDYTSEATVWLVAQSWVDGAPFSWTRVGYEGGPSADNGSRVQIPYERLVQELSTDDFVTYLTMLQGEGEADWEINKATVGYPVK